MERPLVEEGDEEVVGRMKENVVRKLKRLMGTAGGSVTAVRQSDMLRRPTAMQYQVRPITRDTMLGDE